MQCLYIIVLYSFVLKRLLLESLHFIFGADKKGVYEKVPRSKVEEVQGTTITTRWVDINKGDDLNKNYRIHCNGPCCTGSHWEGEATPDHLIEKTISENPFIM